MFIASKERIRERAKGYIFGNIMLSYVLRKIRAWQVKSRYKKISNRYSLKEPDISPVAILEKRSANKLSKFRKIKGKPRILFVGTDYAQDMSGMMQGLMTIGDVTVFHQENGDYGIKGQLGKMSLALKEPIGQRISWYLEQAIDEGREYDILIGQFWGGYHDENVFSGIFNESKTIIINICMDDRHAFDNVQKAGVSIGTKLLDNNVDLVLTAAPETVNWHTKEGCPAFYFPEASSPEYFANYEGLKKEYDVVFVGQAYGIRKKLVKKLLDSGIKVTAFGSGWPLGYIDVNDVPKLFASAKIILGVGTIGHCDDFVGLKLRDFDAPMSGSFYITTYNQDLETLYEIGEEIEVYRNLTDCVEKCQYYLGHEIEREIVARNGKIKVMTCHTWEQRFQNLMQMLNGYQQVVYDTECARLVKSDN